mmetsp:Transcript_21026/g.37248  ORF Transcript_21026/g.37248 Transcript_21026/m.37248 type:complete len:656 (-) Transcript_21026:41-2008(-)
MERAKELEDAICGGGLEQANQLGELVKLFKQVSRSAKVVGNDDVEGDDNSGSEWSSEDDEEGQEERGKDNGKFKVKLAVLHASRRSFACLLERGDFKPPKTSPEGGSALGKFHSWIEARYIDFLRTTAKWLERPHAVLQVAALRTLLFFVQRDSQRFRNPDEVFGQNVFRLLTGAVVKSASLGGLSGQVNRVLAEEYLESYADVRHYMLLCIRDLCNIKFKQLKASRNGSTGNDMHESSGDDDSNDNDGDDDKSALAVTEAKWAIEGLEDVPMEVFAENIFNLLYATPFVDDKSILKAQTSWLVTPGESLDGAKVKKAAKVFRREFQVTWMSFLRLPGLPKRLYRQVLLTLPKRIMPHLLNPLQLSDFLTDAYDIGGLTAVLALTSLFKLISEHGLDYPDFFGKLYRLMDLSVLHAKHRDQFFSLLDQFLSSAHLASYLVAAFAKKILRLALMAPPGSSMFAIVFVSNLIKRHPTCISLVHKEEAEPVQNEEEPEDINVAKRAKLDEIKAASLRLALGQQDMNESETKDVSTLKRKRGEASVSTKADDPFIFAETDPAKCRALESSLWEIDALLHHYNPHVSLLVKGLFHTELKATVTSKKIQPLMPMQDFYGITYRNLFDREMKKARKAKSVPLTFVNVYGQDKSSRPESVFTL